MSSPHSISARFEIPFKGERRYIQSADVLNVIKSTLEVATQIDFQINTMITHPVILRTMKEAEFAEARLLPDFCGRMVYQDATGARSFLAVLQDLGAEHQERIAFDEAAIIAGHEIDGRSIRHTRPDSEYAMERIVALNKQLLNICVQKKAWIFTRLQLANLHLAAQTLRLEIDAKSSSRLSKTVISTPEGPAGHIYFI